MAITKEHKILKYEIVGDFRNIQVLEALIVKEDGVEIARKEFRKSFNPSQDTSKESDEIKGLASLFHTESIKSAFNEHIENQNILINERT